MREKQKAKGWRWVNLAMIALLAFAGMVAIVCVFQIPGLIAKGLNIGPPEIGMFMTIYLVAMFVTSLFAGRIIDKVGPKASIIMGVIIVTLASIFFGASPTYGYALASRFILGVGTCFWFTAAPAILGMWAPPSELPIHQGVYFGFQFVGSGTAGIIIPIWGGAGWSMTLYYVAALVFVSVIVIAILLRGRPG